MFEHSIFLHLSMLNHNLLKNELIKKNFKACWVNKIINILYYNLITLKKQIKLGLRVAQLYPE